MTIWAILSVRKTSMARLGVIEKLPVTTWLFEEGTFVPAAKLTANKKLSIVANYMGTPEAMYDSEGKKSWSCELNSYGKVRNFEGEYKTDCPFRYQGQYEDAETGLYYNRFRYYDPQTGNYLSQDPIAIEGGLNVYAYVHDPNKWVDSLGLSPNLNTNTATGNFGVYEIKINGELHKIGKVDLDRITQSSGLPTRLHQQIRILEKTHGKGNVTGTVVDKGFNPTADAKAAETKRLQVHYDKTGKVLDGNKKSFKPKTKCGG